VSVGELLGQVLPLALGAMISPTLLALQVLVLSSPRSPRAKAWALVVGAAVTLAAFALVVGVLLTQATAATPTHQHGWTFAILRTVAGLLLVTIGLRQFLAPPTPSERHHERAARLAGAGPRLYFGVGAVGMLTDVSSLVLFVPAMHAITRSSADDGAKALVFGVLCLCVLAPVLVPALLVSLLGRRADPALAALNRFVTGHQRQINAGICFVFAAFLLVTGLAAIPALL